ncbi:hypothetical protein H257_03967 [Aphanomyces astaci]|uniref:Uncharacterized protein n=1 Tax=Aphanomyces astaci TaxID=112090 RepID=W4GU14_APHAT|nr:hypothetical protein H257_03967 [Aphanomyces astaci]ETV83167.1 hypothetical protein H257_03967 [Aphanomyces astaci]|eukprot:XP_009826597.1 hypothetical protein H257_03967 [Aphanomyces astaci]
MMKQIKLSALIDRSKDLTKKRPSRAKRTLTWWKEHYGKSLGDATTNATTTVDSVYRAIVDNDTQALDRLVSEHPMLAFTKLFGPGKRTALYVASMLGKVECVRVLIAHGADKHLACDGYPPVQVAGLCTPDPVPAMRIKYLLGAFSTPQVLLRRKACLPGSKRCRVEIHFSEPIWDFVQDDIQVDGCQVTSLSMYRADFFVAMVDITAEDDDAKRPTVQIPAKVARRQHTNRLNDASPVLYLS